jgi:hypothetical protein
MDMTSLLFNDGLAAAQVIGLISAVLKGALSAGYCGHIWTDDAGEMVEEIPREERIAVGSTASC